MNSPTNAPRSLAAKASWTSLGLAAGCAFAFIVFAVIDETIGFAHTRQGVLTGFLPRAALYTMWAGTGLAVIVGLGTFVFIRRTDITSKAIIGIATRSLIGVTVGLGSCVLLWLYIGHRVIGF
jgi:hypothetical protein